MSPGHKRQIIVAMVDRGRCTAREACRHFGLHRSTFSYDAKQPDAWMAKLKAALRRMSREHPEMGYVKIAQAPPLWDLHGTADESDPSQSRMDVGLRARHDDARWQAAHADRPR